MSTLTVQESAITDRTDLQIVQCLQISPRVAFRRVGEVLGVSEQTVARRYRRLRTQGAMRVVGLVNPDRLGETSWQVRIQCRPDATAAIGSALARRDDVSWVALASGGSEIVAVLRSRSQQQRDELLLQQLPRTAQVLSISAFATLHIFRGASSDDWRIDATLLTARQRTAIGATRRVPRVEPEPLRADDEPMIEVLARDGRATVAQLADATGWTEAKAGRRLDVLESSGTVFLDVDLAADLFGYPISAYLWLTVPPAAIDSVGRRLAKHPQVAFAAAVTGPASLVATVLCRDADDLYRYLSGDIGKIEGIGHVEVSPTVRRIKQAGSLLDGQRLSPPAPARR
ncbi:MAG: Lrp/AsnC family transcriptional regulator [Jatrophihabitans sp.]